jgi:preprotein translocase subunit YajC
MNFYNLLGFLNATIVGGQTTPIPDGSAAAAVTDAAVGAATDAAAVAPDMAINPMMWLIYPVMIVALYFLMIRPQRKRDKQMKEMQDSISTGDNIVTTSGLFGKVVDKGEDCFVVEFGTNRGVRIPVRKSDVSGIRTPNINPSFNSQDSSEKK